MSGERNPTRKEKAVAARQRRAADARRLARNERRRQRRAEEREYKRLRELFDLELLQELLVPERAAGEDALLRDPTGEAWSPGEHASELDLASASFRGDPDSDAFQQFIDECDQPLAVLVLASGWKAEGRVVLRWESDMPISWTLSIWEAHDGAGRGALIQSDEIEGTRRIACFRGDGRPRLVSALVNDLVATNGTVCRSGLMGGLPTSIHLDGDTLDPADVERAFWVFAMGETQGRPQDWSDIEDQLRSAFPGGGDRSPEVEQRIAKALQTMKPVGFARRTTQGEGSQLRERRALLKVWFEEVCG